MIDKIKKTELSRTANMLNRVSSDGITELLERAQNEFENSQFVESEIIDVANGIHKFVKGTHSS